MIIRVFSAKVRPGKQQEFERIVKEEAIPMLEKHKGVVAEYAGRPFGTNSDDFTFVTVWKDMSDLKEFAGKDWEEALLSVEALQLLEETHINHFEVYHSRSK